jgi:hypothetical protein
MVQALEENSHETLTDMKEELIKLFHNRYVCLKRLVIEVAAFVFT